MSGLVFPAGRYRLTVEGPWPVDDDGPVDVGRLGVVVIAADGLTISAADFAVTAEGGSLGRGWDGG